VLDEIDLLRGKLSQLERNVLTAAAMATPTSGSQQPQPQQPGSTTAAAAPAQAAAGAGADGGMINIQALLASLGLGGDVAADLSAVGVGPLGADMGASGQGWSGNGDAELSLR
jgi:hypothetical protein